ncbi:MAG: extracellular solute-binding protein, partial [Chloroflexota bacterium]
IKRDDLFPQSWKYGSYKGKTYGIPAVESFVRWGLVANEELLAKQGLNPAKMPATWDELLAWHQELTVLDPATKAITQNGIDPRGSMANGTGGGDPFLWGPAWGFKYYDEAKEQFDLANPMMEEALTSMKRFYDVAGGYQARQEFRKQYGNWTGARSGITVGTEAMQINGYWTPGSLAKLVPENRYAYGWVPVSSPRKGKNIQATGGHFAILPTGAPHPEPAFEFLEFLSGEQAEQIIFDGIGWLGARKSFLTKIDVSRYRGLEFFVQSATTTNEMWESAVNPIEGFFGTEWGKQVEAVMLGQLSPKSALQELQRICTEELQRRLGKA